MTEPKTHRGSCHCGRMTFETSADLSTGLISCNCSICARTGAIMAFLPTDQITLGAEDEITDYQFGKKAIHHLFCSVCGVRAYGRGTAPDGTTMYMINLRCIDELDHQALEVTRYDGRSL